jgi:hypothetical protein
MREVRLIVKHAERDWRAAAWILERRNPDRYGRNPVQPMELTTPPARHRAAGGTIVSSAISYELSRAIGGAYQTAYQNPTVDFGVRPGATPQTSRAAALAARGKRGVHRA